jgi:hypothetical protein
VAIAICCTRRPPWPSGSRASIFEHCDDSDLAVIGGATGWEDIETYAESHQNWLSTLLALPNGIPHADTYRRLFERLNPEALERCFMGWVKQIVAGSGAQVIPIDGKTINGSYDRHHQAIGPARRQCMGQ